MLTTEALGNDRPAPVSGYGTIEALRRGWNVLTPPIEPAVILQRNTELQQQERVEKPTKPELPVFWEKSKPARHTRMSREEGRARKKKILAYMRTHKNTTSLDIAELLGCPVKKAANALVAIRKSGEIHVTGTRANPHGVAIIVYSLSD